MRAHHVLLLSLCLLAAAYAVLLFVSPAAAPIGVTLTVVGLVLVSTRYAWFFQAEDGIRDLDK